MSATLLPLQHTSRCKLFSSSRSRIPSQQAPRFRNASSCPPSGLCSRWSLHRHRVISRPGGQESIDTKDSQHPELDGALWYLDEKDAAKLQTTAVIQLGNDFNIALGGSLPNSDAASAIHQLRTVAEDAACSVDEDVLDLTDDADTAAGLSTGTTLPEAPSSPAAACPPASEIPTTAAAGVALQTKASSEPSHTQQQPQQSQQQQQQQQDDTTAFGVPRSILVISLCSMALTSASCVFNTLLPIYLVSELKISMRSMGMFEGLLEAFSYVVRMFSGVVSDMMTSRKTAIATGFALGAAAKFGMSGATSVTALFMGKAADRLANGIQAAPRDALIGDLSPADSRSACFGFAQSLRKWGSGVGALMAYVLMRASQNNYQLIFYMASAVSALSCIAFVMLVPAHAKQQQQEQQQQGKQQEQQQGGLLGGIKYVLSAAKAMPKEFYRMMAVISLYGMGHINESLLEARAIEVGFGKAESTLVVALLSFMVFLCAVPVGKLDDKYGPRVTFSVGMASLVLGDLVLLQSGAQPWAVFAACVCWGVHWSVLQGPLLSLVVGLSPAKLRGAAFGIFYTVMAFTAVTANTMYGQLWHSFGANAAFATSAGLIGVTLLCLPWLIPAKDEGKLAVAA